MEAAGQEVSSSSELGVTGELCSGHEEGCEEAGMPKARVNISVKDLTGLEEEL